MQRQEMELLAVRATLWRMEIELLREIKKISDGDKCLRGSARAT